MKRIPAERWLPVVGCEGHYEVSSHGRIRSLKWGKVRLRRISIHSKDGHRFIMLSMGAKRKQYVVARLVLLAFVGPPPSPAHVACHDPEGNQNDYLWRLRWDTVCENNRDTVRHGTNRWHKFGAVPAAKLTDGDVAEILVELVAGVSQSKIARDYKVTQETVSRIKTGNTWRHVPRPAGLPSPCEVRTRSLAGFTDEELLGEVRLRKLRVGR